MQTKFTRSGLAAILLEAEYWLANPKALKQLLTNKIVTAELVRNTKKTSS